MNSEKCCLDIVTFSFGLVCIQQQYNGQMDRQRGQYNAIGQVNEE